MIKRVSDIGVKKTRGGFAVESGVVSFYLSRGDLQIRPKNHHAKV